MLVFVFKQKTAYEMRISDWSSDVCSSDLQNVCCQSSGVPPCAMSKKCVPQLRSSSRNRQAAVSDGSASTLSIEVVIVLYMNSGILAIDMPGARMRDRKSVV